MSILEIAPNANPTEGPNQGESFYGKRQVLSRVPFSDTTLWRRVRDGGFPAPVRISPGRVAWKSSDVDAWIARTGR